MFRAQQNQFDDAVGKLHHFLLHQIHHAPRELASLEGKAWGHLEPACAMCLLTIFASV